MDSGLRRKDEIDDGREKAGAACGARLMIWHRGKSPFIPLLKRGRLEKSFIDRLSP